MCWASKGEEMANTKKNKKTLCFRGRNCIKRVMKVRGYRFPKFDSGVPKMPANRSILISSNEDHQAIKPAMGNMNLAFVMENLKSEP